MTDDMKPTVNGGPTAGGENGNKHVDLARYGAALEALSLDHPVIAVKFAAAPPPGLPRLSKKVALCAMLKEAQQAGGFYATKEEHGCLAGAYVLGHIEHDPLMESGRIGPALGVYETAAANQQVYKEMVRFAAGTFPYTWFAPLDELEFEPDLVIITARPSQAEVIMRAHGFKTGAAWEARGTTVLGCASLYAYPHLAGKMNLLISGLHHGMRARELFPEGLLFIAIPASLIPEVLGNLVTMAERGLLDLPQYHWGKDAHEAHMRELAESLAAAEQLPGRDRHAAHSRLHLHPQE